MSNVENKNAYLESRALWNDVYGSIQTKLENSYRIIFCLCIALIIAIIGLVIVASETKIKPMPFVLHGDDIISLNEQNSASFNTMKPTLSLILAKDFIRHARAQSSDQTVNANIHIAALSTVTGAASKILQDFFQSENANPSSQQTTKNISITSVLRETKHAFEIRWSEETRNAQTGDVINTAQYIADITYTFDAPSSNPIILKNNPLGFVITHLSWSQDQSTPGA